MWGFGKSASSCPSDDEIADYLLGNSEHQNSVRLASHLQECPRCSRAAAQMEGLADPLINSLRSPTSSSFLHEKGLASALETLETLTTTKEEPEIESLSIPLPYPMRDYVLVELIGVGGMGQVYRAIHRRLKKTVAIKLLDPRRTREPASVSQFYREMEVIGQIETSGIVRAFDAGCERGLHYLVMEYVDGINLSQMLSRYGPLRYRDAVEIIHQVATGLEFVHAKGIVHRDIKPSNLMLDREGRVKILDLGLACLNTQTGTMKYEWDVVRESEGTMHASDTVAAINSETIVESEPVGGTTQYMAPEQARIGERVDARADMFALGCTFFRLLTGFLPFERRDIRKIEAGSEQLAIPKLVQWRTDAPETLQNLVALMLEPDRRKRLSSMSNLLMRLEALKVPEEVQSPWRIRSASKQTFEFMIGQMHRRKGRPSNVQERKSESTAGLAPAWRQVVRYPLAASILALLVILGIFIAIPYLSPLRDKGAQVNSATVFPTSAIFKSPKESVIPDLVGKSLTDQAFASCFSKRHYLMATVVELKTNSHPEYLASIYDLNEMRVISRLNLGRDYPTYIMFGPTEETLLIGNSGGEAIFWHFWDKRSARFAFGGPAVSYLTCCTDNKVAVCLTGDHQVHLLDLKQEVEIRSLSFPEDRILQADWSNEGANLYLTLEGGRGKVVDIGNGSSFYVEPGTSETVNLESRLSGQNQRPIVVPASARRWSIHDPGFKQSFLIPQDLGSNVVVAEILDGQNGLLVFHDGRLAIFNLKSGGINEVLDLQRKDLVEVHYCRELHELIISFPDRFLRYRLDLPKSKDLLAPSWSLQQHGSFDVPGSFPADLAFMPGTENVAAASVMGDVTIYDFKEKKTKFYAKVPAFESMNARFDFKRNGGEFWLSNFEKSREHWRLLLDRWERTGSQPLPAGVISYLQYCESTNSWLALGNEGTLELITPDSRKSQSIGFLPRYIQANGEERGAFAFASTDGNIAYVDVKTEKITHWNARATIHDLAVSGKGDVVAILTKSQGAGSASELSEVLLYRKGPKGDEWNPPTRIYSTDKPLTKVALNWLGDVAVCGSANGSLVILDGNASNEVLATSQLEGPIEFLRYNPTSKTFLTCIRLSSSLGKPPEFHRMRVELWSLARRADALTRMNGARDTLNSPVDRR